MNLLFDEIKTQVDLLAPNLLDALENNDQVQALVAQQALSRAIATVWNKAEESEINPKIKAIFRLVVDWGVIDLPNLIHDPLNTARIKRDLKLFQRTLVMFS